MPIFSPLNYKQAILSTLAFFDDFDYPLTLEELENYLFRLPSNQHQIELYLKNSPRVSEKEGQYCLVGREKVFELRKERKKLADTLWKKVNRFRILFQILPYLRLVAVCNNLAYDNPSPESDIDLLVITSPNRLFLARTLLTFWLHLLGVRRHGEKIKGRFCLSFYLAETHFNLEEIQIRPYDIYLAYWFKTLQPVSGRWSSYQKFLLANQPWLRTYFPASFKPQEKHFKRTPLFFRSFQKIQEIILNTPLGEALENKLKKWQKKRALKKRANLGEKASIIIQDDILKFHALDQRSAIRRAWEKKITALLGRPKI